MSKYSCLFYFEEKAKGWSMRYCHKDKATGCSL